MSAHWVSPTGEATWANAESETPLSGIACTTVEAIGYNVVAGDVVYLRGGTYPYSTYLGRHLDLSGKNGTAINWIVISNYNDEAVDFVGTYGTRMWGLAIQESSYILIHGLDFSDYSDYLINAGSHHLEISYCTFMNITSPYRGGTFSMNESSVGGATVDEPVSHIWIHHSVFYKLVSGGENCGDEGGDALRIGYASNVCMGGTCAEGLNTNITIEDCHMAYGGHVTFDNYGQKTVIKNNISHNEPWYPEYDISCRDTAANPSDEYTNPAYTGLYSHRNWSITDTFISDKRFNLYEGNRIGHPGINPNNDGSTNLSIGSPGNIIRFNYLYNAMHNNMKTKWGDTAFYGWQGNGGCRNRIYHNTLYKSGYGYQPFMDAYPWPMPLRGFRYYNDGQNPGNVFLNNIVYNSYAGDHGADDIQDCTSIPDSVEENNWGTNTGHGCIGSGDPMFVNPDLLQPVSEGLPDLRLRSNSPCIEKATHLTRANGGGSGSTVLVVDDALYFQDGTWGAEMTHGVTLFPDEIAIGNPDNVVAVASVDYATNTITLAEARSWNDEDPVWLYKDSDGERVLFGPAPNIGAYQGPGLGVEAGRQAGIAWMFGR